jgi:hypothetical protein
MGIDGGGAVKDDRDMGLKPNGWIQEWKHARNAASRSHWSVFA